MAVGDHRWGVTPVSDLKTSGGSLDSDGPIDATFHTTNNSEQRLQQTFGFLLLRPSRRGPVAGQRSLNRSSVCRKKVSDKKIKKESLRLRLTLKETGGSHLVSPGNCWNQGSGHNTRVSSQISSFERKLADVIFLSGCIINLQRQV